MTLAATLSLAEAAEQSLGRRHRRSGSGRGRSGARTGAPIRRRAAGGPRRVSALEGVRLLPQRPGGGGAARDRPWDVARRNAAPFPWRAFAWRRAAARRRCPCPAGRPFPARRSTPRWSRRRSRPGPRSCRRRGQFFLEIHPKRASSEVRPLLLQPGRASGGDFRAGRRWPPTDWVVRCWPAAARRRRSRRGADRGGRRDDGGARFLPAGRGLHGVRRRRLHRAGAAGGRPAGRGRRLRRRLAAGRRRAGPRRRRDGARGRLAGAWPAGGTGLARHAGADAPTAAGRGGAAVRGRRRGRLCRAVHRRGHGLGAGVGDGRGAAGRRTVAAGAGRADGPICTAASSAGGSTSVGRRPRCCGGRG